MKHEETPDTKAAPAIGFSIQHQIDQERTCVFQGFVPMEASDAEVNSALDKIFRASNRQRAALRLPSVTKDLARLEKARKRFEEDIVRLDAEHEASRTNAASQAMASGKRNAVESAQARSQRQKNEADRANAVTSITRLIEDIDLLKAEKAELEKTVAGEG